ncbi:MAG: hypothetical protein WA700_05290 [Acidobacteriaceae bacterium]
MNRLQFGALGLSLLLPAAALADFHYEETTQVTGGSMMGMMKMAGAFSNQARDINAPTVSAVYVQGNRMARVNAQTMEIIDLDKETITNIDMQKHTYTQMTFEQMRQQFQQTMQQMKENQAQQPTAPAQPQPQPPINVQLEFKVNVRNTGATKQVSGLDATESILTMQMVGTDTTNDQQGAFAITNDMWMVPEIPGYGEIRDFYMRMGAKMGDMFNASSLSSSFAAMQQPAASQGMAQMIKEMSKLKGIPVEQVMRMGATANGEPLPAASEAPLPPNPSAPPPPTAGEVAQQSASSAIANKLGSFGIGGFGGFGHKKQQQEPPPPADDDSTSTTQQAPTATVLMESTTQLTEFSTAPIDSGKFAIPAGFTQIQPQQMP